MTSDRERLEWLEPDGRGGFASGTASGVRTRRYHALLLKARRPPAERFVLVNGFEAWVETGGAAIPITTQRYAPDVRHPDGASRIARFAHEPWPAWTFDLGGGASLEQEILVEEREGRTLVSWKLAGAKRGESAVLCVRLLLSCRDYHALHRENRAFRFDAILGPGAVAWRPYDGAPGVRVEHNGAYEHAPLWYRNFAYVEERERGLDFREDLASPGVLRFELSRGEAAMVLSAEPGVAEPAATERETALARAKEMRARERKRRAAFAEPLDRAAEGYFARRGKGRTVVSGYPWFTDWGRDTFIALRGLALATGRLDEARDVLLEWSGAISRGMLPNRFPDHGEEPEYNSVDASLWFAIAAGEFLSRAPASGLRLGATDESRLHTAVDALLDGASRGTRHRIAADGDGLLKAGEPGFQLTWMDAKIGDHVVTPRIGKPVEVQALWLNALHLASAWSPRWKETFERGLARFEKRFWNEAEACLYDVVDVDHQPGVNDGSIRPNQIFAVGGLPLQLLAGEKARAVVDRVEEDLWTPLGLRTLAPDDAAYRGTCEGDARARDGAYHQGTAWPWLLGAFADAWVRVRGGTDDAKREARARFVAPLRAHLEEAGLGHVSEIADGDAPHRPRGCPFQAWSMGELLRLERVILAPATPGGEEAKPAAAPAAAPARAAAGNAAAAVAKKKPSTSGVPTAAKKKGVASPPPSAAVTSPPAKKARRPRSSGA